METHTRKFAGFIGVATLSKLLLNTARRLIYPFAPEFARGLNTDYATITSVIAANQATSLLGPFCASFADRYGFRLFMLLSLAMLIIGTFALGLIPIFAMLVFCFFLVGLAKSIFDASLQAVIGNLVPIESRGKIIGITELSWAASTLIGIPLVGLTIKHFSWQAPFFIIGGLTLACLLLLMLIMPKPPKSRPDPSAQVISKRANWKKILKDRKVVAILVYIFFASLANDNLFVVYGLWLEQSYSLSLVTIGFSTILIGCAELMGEGFTAAFSDRIGLRKLTLIGIMLCTLSYILLPLLNVSLFPALFGIFLVFFTFEFTVVTSMSLSTELVPELRASTMSAFYATAGLGRVIGALTGGLLWSDAGILWIAVLSAACMFISLIFFYWGFYRPLPEPA